MPKPEGTAKVYTGVYLENAHHLVRLLVEIKKYDKGLKDTQQFYFNDLMTNTAQRTINRAEALIEAFIYPDGTTVPPIPSET
jgi:hypothetical protein